jgi:hypothetical protein
VAATVQAQYANSSGPTLANAETGVKFNREDTETGTTPVPIPTSTGTEFSWLKALALVVTGTSTTSMSNRRFSLSTTETSGLGVHFYGLANYTQSISTVPGTVEAAGGQRPANPGVTIANYTYGANPTLMPSAAISGSITNMVTSVAPGNSPQSSVTLANSGNNIGTNVHIGEWLILDAGTANAELIQVHITTVPTGTTITFNTNTTKNHATTATHIGLAPQRATGSNILFDNRSVSTGSAAVNGDFASTFVGVDSGYAGGAGSAIGLPNILLTYDEA